MSEIIRLDDQLEKAWNAYRAEAVRLMHEPRLLTDRLFMERLKRAERRWTQIFHMQDAA